MTHNVLLTRDRIHKFLPNVTTDCLIFGDHPEIIDHQVFECPLRKLLWWNSPWQIRIEAFHCMEFEQWMEFMLDKLPKSHMDVSEIWKM